MRAGAALLGVLLALPGTALSAVPDCTQGLLERLGWRFESAAVTAPDVHGGPVCTREDLRQAHAQGDLRATLPRQWQPAERAEFMQHLLDDPASVCAYAMRVGEAARRAAHALESNPGYRFSGLQLGWIGFGARGAQSQGWQRTRSLGRGYQPAGSNSQALAAFYTGSVRSECGVGRQVAQLATQRELHGDASFDTAFDNDELGIGTFLGLHDTDSILLGAHAGELFADGKAVRTSAMGRQAFMGAPGYITHALGRETLDDLNNQAENFIVVDVGAEAADALRQHGGFGWYDQRNRELWELSRQLPRRGVRFFERLLADQDPSLRASLTDDEAALVARMDDLLDDPFYRQFLIFVHPRGIKPIGFHVARLLDRNPRTPFTVELTVHNLHTTLYRRWQQAQLRHCAATGTPGSLTSDSGPGGDVARGPSTQR